MSDEVFEPKGRVSVRDASMTLIRSIKPKDGITYTQAIQDIEELTGLTGLEQRDIMGPMNSASKALRRLGEAGVYNRRTIGWRREDPDDTVSSGIHHEQKAKRQVRWAVEAVANVQVESLSWEARGKRDGVLDRNRRQTEIESRRAQRRRPIQT